MSDPTDQPHGATDTGFPGIPSRADVLRDRRVQYESAGLDVDDLAAEPVEQWRRWHDQALDAGVAEPNAMTVATIGADGVPDARIVLARGADEHGLVFY
ncbi:MAG: pyridoxamine 5'-phosphate oxidase family protein, partial [Ilumatobacteraceae bacterium]